MDTFKYNYLKTVKILCTTGSRDVKLAHLWLDDSSFESI